MRKLKLLTVAVLALALLAIPGTAVAKSRDRDHDHMADKWEKRHHLNTHRKDGKLDPDKDGVSNLREFRGHTDPHDADSNDDGIGDGGEVAGTIASFDSNTDVLTITTASGDVSGTVDNSTEIKCEGQEEQEDANDDNDRVTAARHGDGENSGPGSTDEQGDREDDRGENEQQGENEACTTADLTQGTQVREAELRLGNPNTFTELELVK